MPSAFEYFSIIKKQPVSTPISQLGISNPLNTLQLRSQHYFTIKAGAVAAGNNVLAVSMEEGQYYDPYNSEHNAYLDQCIDLVKKSSTRLKYLDLKITTSVIVGVVAASLSFFPLCTFLGLIGWGAALYYMYQRATAHAEYQEALTLLVATCNWSLGMDQKSRESSTDELTTNPSIRKMMAVLYPVLTKNQVKHLIAKDVEDIFVGELHEYKRKYEVASKDDKIALSKKGAEFKRCIYGFNKGSAIDFLDALASVLPDLYRAAYHGFQQFQNWLQKKTGSPQQLVPLTMEEYHDEGVTLNLASNDFF